MINSNYRKSYKKISFIFVLMVYIAGIILCCVYMLKNSENLSFLEKVITVSEKDSMSNTAILALMVRNLMADIFYVVMIILLKYSGILKGLCVLIPPICSFRKTCVYIIMISKKIDILEIITFHILKDTAVSFLVILLCSIVFNEVMSSKFNIKKDIVKIIVYCTGLFAIYSINCATMIFI